MIKLYLFFSFSSGGSRIGLQRKEKSVEMKEVFSIKLKRRRFAGQEKGGILLGITIFACLKKEGNKLKDTTINLGNISEDHCYLWYRSLKKILKGKYLFSYFQNVL